MNEIAQEEGVSIKYLEQIVSLLKPLGILESVRGAHGGYCLIKEPSSISLAEIFASLGALSPSSPCLENPNICPRVDVCTTKPFWQEFDMHIHAYLAGVSLADVVAAGPKGGAEFRGKII